ncbi:hypothetical protein H4R19_002495 [Coemansia spiralis]|nr:hypothetical protein H4R19_002495 [Coemansia spiralis]
MPPLPVVKPLEPGFWDISTLVTGAVLTLLNTILFAYAAVHHQYPPLRAKNMRLISLLWLCTVIWYIGIIGTNFNLSHLFGSKTSYCTVFGLWFRILFGVFAFIFIHIMRLYVYIRIFLKARRVTYRVYVTATVFYALIILIYGVPMSILSRTLTVKFVQPLQTCIYGRLFIELSFSVVWAGWAGIVTMAYKARKINTSFREYHEMLLIVILCTIAVLYETISQHIYLKYTLHQWSRVVSTVAEYLACQSSLVILLGVPVYNCIFHREEYKRKFFRKMREDGMSSRYGLTLQLSNTTELSSFARAGAAVPPPAHTAATVPPAITHDTAALPYSIPHAATGRV